MSSRPSALSFTATLSDSSTLKPSVLKAIKHAEESGSHIFSGVEAFTEVAKANGLWDWALVGPDPEKLPLTGGGAGGIEEMRSIAGMHPFCFGLLRIAFNDGGVNKIRFIFIHASACHGGGPSVKARGQAMVVEPKMEAVIKKFAPIAAKVRFSSIEDVTIDFLLNKLYQALPLDKELFTVENCARATEYSLEHQASGVDRQQLLKSSMTVKGEHFKLERSDSFPAPRARAASVHPEVLPMHEQDTHVQRKKAKLFGVGDPVEVFSIKNEKWIPDGEIIEVIQENCTMGGFKLRAGSMKVLFENGRRFKWVAPQCVCEQLRPSDRVRAPEPTIGTLEMEVHGDATEWCKVHVEINKGYIQWWENSDDARAGQQSVGVAYLLGLECHDEITVLKLRTKATQSAVFTFNLESQHEAQMWITSLWEHAGYCEEMRDVFESKQKRKELLRGA